MAVEHGRPVILTEMVLERNEWAKALVGRPGIHVAGSLRSLLAVVDRLIAGAPTSASELRRFALSVSMLDRRYSAPDRGPRFMGRGVPPQSGTPRPGDLRCLHDARRRIRALLSMQPLSALQRARRRHRVPDLCGGPGSSPGT